MESYGIMWNHMKSRIMSIRPESMSSGQSGQKRQKQPEGMAQVWRIACLEKGMHGITWNHLESHGITRNQMESLGIKWNHRGSCGRVSEPDIASNMIANILNLLFFAGGKIALVIPCDCRHKSSFETVGRHRILAQSTNDTQRLVSFVPV